ncbi:MAG: nucleotidyltransferase domain-containing protein [Candidatus Acidulodesulfobacterium sp.]
MIYNKVRLNENEVKIIKHFTNLIFTDPSLYIFGSRADLSQKGGDIDIYIETSDDALEIFNKKINFLTELTKKLGEQKIDVIIKGKNSKDKDIFNIAKKTGVML